MRSVRLPRPQAESVPALFPSSQQSFQFFVRTKATKEEVENVFHKVEFVDAGVQGEIGFVTCEMTQKMYDDKSMELSDVIQMIRFA